MPTAKLPERLSRLSSQLGLQALVGDIHNHCNLSYGHGSLEGALSNARRQLDFVSVTGHAYWPDMPVDDPSVSHIVDFHIRGFEKLRQTWPSHFDTLKRFHLDGEFTVFPGYEMHSCAHGDYTVVLKSLQAVEMVQRDTPSELRDGLKQRFGSDAFAFPHHIGYRTGARGINWESFDESLSPVLELISMHGCSETSLVDRPFLHSMGPSDGLNTVHNGWNKGHVFGVIGNTDHHSGYPGSYGHGRGTVYASENSSDAIWSGIFARRTNAQTGDNIHLLAAMNGVPQGSFVAPTKNAQIAVEAVAGSFIDYIDVIKNGVVVDRITPSLRPAPVDRLTDEVDSIFVLEFGWGARGSFHDWKGSVRVHGGAFDAVEPRLRGPEIVSPLEGSEVSERSDRVELEGDSLRFDIRAASNPNNATATTQAIAARVRLRPGASFTTDFGGQSLHVTADRLFEGALSGNLGAIDTPAFRFHPLPRSEQWQWQGLVSVGELRKGDWVSLRLRQMNGQWAWGTAFFCR
jgi:hypothetical protein